MESDDGLAFDIDALTATVIREEMEYGGVRLKTAAYLERTRIPITIDIGFGEAMADATQRLDYPTLLDFPAPQVRSYPPATVIAEKLQAMVALGALKGRMKDYYDLWAIPRAIDISADDLDAAIRASGRPRIRSREITSRPPREGEGLLHCEIEGDARLGAGGGGSYAPFPGLVCVLRLSAVSSIEGIQNARGIDQSRSRVQSDRHAKRFSDFLARCANFCSFGGVARNAAVASCRDRDGKRDQLAGLGVQPGGLVARTTERPNPLKGGGGQLPQLTHPRRQLLPVFRPLEHSKPLHENRD
ncbi:hypothetical protein MPL3365_170203 [Mesorhizobium plurifarium]|uniref:Uncharacterized protein n=1 Tax=Mesorhizobium plurifarium TaxID=69974 RepID=A0A090FZ55_MESPL|nr:hypothetical protein MPL3365_170203 [Mesorhizobium plurifarium]